MKDILKQSEELKGKPYKPSWQDKLARIMIPEMKEWEGKTIASCKKTVAFVEDLLKQAKLEVIESHPKKPTHNGNSSAVGLCDSYLCETYDDSIEKWKEDQKELINASIAK